MEAEASSTNHLARMVHDLLPVVTPVLLVAIGYVDPGKWAACIDSGARFGGDHVAFMLMFNLVAILCQYLSAHVGVISGRNLAQICSEEYNKATCIFLGLQAELSMIILDFTMVLGIAHGLNMIFGVDLCSSVLLTALNSLTYPLFSTLLEHSKAKALVACAAGLTFLCYILGTLFGQPEFGVSSNDVFSKLGGESAFALMSLLGASIMPHNFYLHSSLVQGYKRPPGVSGSPLSHDNFFAIFTIFSGIFLVNYVLMNSAANVFYSSGLVLLTFQDMMSLMDQAFRNPVAPLGIFLVIVLANQITSVSWELSEESGRTVLHEFFGMDIPGWLHCATIRIFAIVPALYCLWSSGAEGMYQMLIFVQILTALLLPSSVIPLFRIASSRHIMGLHKISPVMEFVSLITFMGIMGLKIIFMAEMIFGDSDWVGNLHLDIGIISISYVFLLVTAVVSLCLVVWLAATPLKSTSARLEGQPCNWYSTEPVREPFTRRDECDVNGMRYHEEETPKKEEAVASSEKPLKSYSDTPVQSYDFDLPETIIETFQDYKLSTIEENCSAKSSRSLSIDPPEKSPLSVSAPFLNVGAEVSGINFVGAGTLKEITVPVETLRLQGDLLTGKDDEEGISWEPEEPEEPSEGSSAASALSTSDGPASLRSVGGKSEEVGTGPGSLSRLSGLGRAARLQMAAILNEFWGQLFDFHGQVTQDAKARNLGLMLGIESKSSQHPTRSASLGKDSGETGSMQTQSIGGRGSDSLANTRLYNSTSQQLLQRDKESAYRIQKASYSQWPNQLQSLDAYVQRCRNNALDSAERRYSSLRLPPSSERLEYQPATIHGCQISSYINRLARDRPSCLNGQLVSAPTKFPSFAANNYQTPSSFNPVGPKHANGLNSLQTSRFSSPTVSRNDMLQPDSTCYDLVSGSIDTLCQDNSKRYHSSPDISRLYLPRQDTYMSDRSPKWGRPNASIGFDRAVGQTNHEQSLYKATGSRAGASLPFDEVSSSNSLRDVFSLGMSSGMGPGSLWSKQPYERFGLGNNTDNAGDDGLGAENSTSFATQEGTSEADTGVELLQSLRECILKLLKLEGSEWLFRHDDGVDEDLIDRVAAREMLLFEVESSERKAGSALDGDDASVSSVPCCGDDCLWKVDLVISFGMWCIRRILELSLMESRPELWGKYTYVLNRLQGIIEPAFFKPRTPKSLCFCIQIPVSQQHRSSPPVSSGQLPPPSSRQHGKGKFTAAANIMEVIKDIEIAITCRKGRSGTAAGDVAFPKGKENLASVLKRYRRRLSNKSMGDGGSGSWKHLNQGSYGS